MSGEEELTMVLLELFWSFVKIGFTSFGGLSMIPLITSEVLSHGWMTAAEVSDIVAIAEMTPGPIALNAATFVGIQVAGLPGALVATLGCILPSCVIVMALAYLYYRYKGLSMVQGILSGLRPAVVAMIASAGLSLLILSLYGARELPADLSGVNWISVGIFTVAILILRRWKVNPIWVMAGAGAAGVLLYSIL